MGASASIVNEGAMPEEFQTLLDLVDKQKFKIAEADSLVLNRESTKIFKKQTKIIDCLTARTKNQLKKMYSASKTNPEDIYKLIGTKDSYARFMQLLFTSREKIDMDLILATNGGEYDEDLMISLISTSTIKELKKLNELYSLEKLHSISDVVDTKMKKDSSIQKFCLLILKCDRDESKNVDFEAAKQQAAIIHQAGASRLIGADEDAIFEILTKVSRLQCQAINEEYQKQYKMKLEKAINMKFKGNCAKLILSWIQPIPHAVASLFFTLDSKMILDKPTIAAHIAKYDKDFLTTVDDACQALYKKSLLTIVQRGFSGNLFKAIKGWIENLTPDRGYERILDLYIEGKRISTNSDALSVGLLTQDMDVQTRVKFLLEKQSQELKKFLIDNKIRFDPNDKFEGCYMSTDSFDEFHHSDKFDRSTARIAGLNGHGSSSNVNSQNNSHNGSFANKAIIEGTAKSEHEDDNKNGGGNGTTVKPLSKNAVIMEARKTVINKYSKKSEESSSNEEEYEHKSNKVYTFLSTYFENRDFGGEGSFPPDEFWEYMKQLPLSDFGLSNDDIDGMREFCEWEQDGLIHFYEAIIEISDSVIAAIEKKEVNNNVSKVIDICVANEKRNVKSDRDTNREKKLFRRETIAPFTNIPVYFMQYLYDTLEAFDLNCNGYLCKDELLQLLEVINIPIALDDIIEDNSITDIAPKVAVTAFATVIQDWFTDGEDHFICLVDAESGAYFWYNTKDETTSWATNLASSENNQDAFEETFVAPALMSCKSTRSTIMVDNPQALYVGDALPTSDRRRSTIMSSPNKGASQKHSPIPNSDGSRKVTSDKLLESKSEASLDIPGATIVSDGIASSQYGEISATNSPRGIALVASTKVPKADSSDSLQTSPRTARSRKVDPYNNTTTADKEQLDVTAAEKAPRVVSPKGSPRSPRPPAASDNVSAKDTDSEQKPEPAPKVSPRVSPKVSPRGSPRAESKESSAETSADAKKSPREEVVTAAVSEE